ncbi:unnamed protein product [Nippostrongylus brasiliensis]|uniref:Secreted protein n=1 Tax=Nippostrongylus brasiliensis TaxID=27835 RepID=A0A0N4YDA2_NIPBR|nr:unnamed protein product [Nippostrongylus brasiliensis]
MFFSRIANLVTVLITSEAIADECKIGNEKFCGLIDDAHEANGEGIKLMNGALDGKGKKTLELADDFVTAVLEAREKQVIAALKIALEEELNAYVRVKGECSALDGSYSKPCDDVLFSVGYVIAGLIEAIVEVLPDGERKTKVDKLISDLISYMLDVPESEYRDKLHDTGKQVLEII